MARTPLAYIEAFFRQNLSNYFGDVSLLFLGFAFDFLSQAIYKYAQIFLFLAGIDTPDAGTKGGGAAGVRSARVVLARPDRRGRRLDSAAGRCGIGGAV